MKKSDQGIFSKWLDSLGVRHAWIFGIAGLFIYKIIDMNTIQWFGETIFITNNSSILGFLVCAVLFWSIIILVVVGILQILGIYDAGL
jgi:hypothetical protein